MSVYPEQAGHRPSISGSAGGGSPGSGSGHSPSFSYPSSPLSKRPPSTTPTPKNNVDLKIIILGHGGVGKTSFIYRYINDNFTETISTIGASFVLKKWRSFFFGIWDTAGQEKFSRISSYYSRGAQAAILAYDITDRSTFDNLTEYAKFLSDAEKDCYIVLVGTKLDLVKADPGMRQVTEGMARELAAQWSAPCFETSSKEGVNVSAVLDTIGYHCFATRLAATSDMTVLPVSPTGSRPSYHDTRPQQPFAERSCCTIQ